MFDLFIPTDHSTAYEWAAVLFAHAFIGLLLVAAVAAALEAWAGEWIDDLGAASLVAVVLAYGIVWEGLIQPQFGEQVLSDAAVDTFAVACGGALGLLSWHRRPLRMAIVAAAFGVVAWFGARARR